MGYAAAVTATAARWALGAGGCQMVPFTDAADPVANRLYPRLGFRFEHDAVERFERCYCQVVLTLPRGGTP